MATTVKVEYVTLPDRQQKTEVLTLAGERVGFAAVIKALTGKEVTRQWGRGWLFRSSAGWAKEVEATIALTKLHIMGSSAIIGDANYDREVDLKGDSFLTCPLLSEVVVDVGEYDIGRYAFADCTSLKKVVLRGFGSISGKAFQGCRRLESVEMQDGVDGQRRKSKYHVYSVGPRAFYRCENLESITIPDSIEFIHKEAFYECYSLRYVRFPSSLRKIEEGAFDHTDVSFALLPEGLTKLGKGVFGSKLRFASIPSTLDTSILSGDARPFNNATSLVLLCDEPDSAKDPKGVSRSLSRDYLTAPRTVEGVHSMVRSREVEDSCRGETARVVQAAPAAGKASRAEGVDADPESLRRYLKLVAEAETAVFQLSEMHSLSLSTRKRIGDALERRRKFESLVAEQMAREQEAAELGAYEEKRREISSGKALTDSDIGECPRSSDNPELRAVPPRPVKPELQKPGLFNRKRVEASNAELMARYREALSEYDAKISQREREIAEFKAALADWNRRREQAIQRQLDELGPFRATTVALAGNDKSDVTRELEYAATANDAMCGEIERKLSEASGLLKLAYSADVIFPKYRNIEAMTTMYEYFEAGRCESLRGANGAYNLFESETRSKAIIAKLDTVSNKLDEISKQLSAMQASQYILFKAVEGVGTRLDSMSGTLESILEQTRETRESAQEVSAKATALVRSCDEIAYWTRENARLTDSLGYLIAFTAL